MVNHYQITRLQLYRFAVKYLFWFNFFLLFLGGPLDPWDKGGETKLSFFTCDQIHSFYCTPKRKGVWNHQGHWEVNPHFSVLWNQKQIVLQNFQPFSQKSHRSGNLDTRYFMMPDERNCETLTSPTPLGVHRENPASLTKGQKPLVTASHSGPWETCDVTDVTDLGHRGVWWSKSVTFKVASGGWRANASYSDIYFGSIGNQSCIIMTRSIHLVWFFHKSDREKVFMNKCVYLW